MVFSLCIILMLRLYVPGMLCWRQRRRPPLTIMTTTISISITIAILSLILHSASSQDIFSGSNFLGKIVPCVKTTFFSSEATYFLAATSLFYFKFMVLRSWLIHKCKHCTDFYVSKKKTFKFSACFPCKYICTIYDIFSGYLIFMTTIKIKVIHLLSFLL